jgi:hypothetical protein
MDSPGLLDLFNRNTGRPKADAIVDATKYTWLKEAQDEVISEIASVAPWVLYQKVGTPSLPVMVTVDHNVFTFGLDGGGKPIEPIGTVQVYRSISDVPDRPLRPEWDYLPEGNQIRLPRNRKYTGTLYWRGIVMPSLLDATHNPALIPTQANELIAIRASYNFASAAGRNPNVAATMQARWASRWPHWCLVWKKQFSRGGALTSLSLKDVVTPLL